MLGLTDAYTFKNYPRFLVIFLGLAVIVGNLIWTDSSAVLGLVVIVSIGLAIYKPKWFIYFAITALMTRYMFCWQQTHFKWVFTGMSPGPLMLAPLRRVDTDSPVFYNLPRAIFLAMAVRNLLVLLREGRAGLRFDKLQMVVFVFLVLFIVSALANLAFTVNSLNLLTYLFAPILTYYYLKSINWEEKDRTNLFSYLMFVGLEMQTVGTMINNIHEMPGKWFYGDNAIGTFVFPLSELSGFLLATVLIIMLYRFLIKRNPADIVRVLLAYYGILSISSVLYLLLVSVFCVASLGIAYNLKIVTAKQLAMSLLALSVIAAPAVWVVNNPDLYYDGAHAQNRMAETTDQKFYEIPKVYSFVNLYHFLRNENTWVFGSGPATFLTNMGKGDMQAKYNSYTVLDTWHLSSSEKLENSFVGLIGELGILAYITYFLFFILLWKDIRRGIRRQMALGGRPDPAYVGVLLMMIFFWGFSLLRNTIEVPEFNVPQAIFISLIVLHEKDAMKKASRQKNAAQKAALETAASAGPDPLPGGHLAPTS